MTKTAKQPSRRTDAQLKRKYRDPEEPGSLGGAARFAKALHNVATRQTRLGARIGLHASQTDATSLSHAQSDGVWRRRIVGGGSGGRSEIEETQQGRELPLDGGGRVFQGGLGRTLETKDGTEDGRGSRLSLQNEQESTAKTTDEVSTVTSRTVSTGKQPRRRFAGKRLPGVTNPHRRCDRTRRRRRSLLSSPSAGGSSGGGGSSDDDDESDASSASSASTNTGGRHRMSQEELRRQLELTYKDGGRPRVARHPSLVSH